MKKTVIVLAALYGCLWVVDYINNSNWLLSYQSFMKEWWELGFVAMLCIWVFNKNKYFKYEILDEMRRVEFVAEIARYENTPYIPQIMLMYMKNPPGSVNISSRRAYVTDTFYRLVVNEFRDRVYVLQDFDSLQPDNRIDYLSVIGIKNLLKCIFYYLLPFIWIGYALIDMQLSLLNSWVLFTAPIILLSWQRATYLLHAFIEYRPSNLDKKIEYADAKREFTWRETFPDNDVGQTFVRAYYCEMERRMRYEHLLNKRKVPENQGIWNSPNFAPFIYPSNDLPVWENEYQPHYDQKVEQAYSNNVINFKVR